MLLSSKEDRAKDTGNTCRKQVQPVKGTDGYPRIPILRPPAAHRFVRFWASGIAKFPKMGDSLPRTPLKFDAASFALAGEICNRTNKNKPTVNDNRLEGFLRRSTKLDYRAASTTFASMCADADDQLFAKVTGNSQHLLHDLLPHVYSFTFVF